MKLSTRVLCVEGEVEWREQGGEIEEEKEEGRKVTEVRRRVDI